MATTIYNLSGTCKVRTLMTSIADSLVTTGKWQKVVDNTPTSGTALAMTQYVIIAPNQTYQFRTAGGTTTDSGAGTSPRYTCNVATGAERIYYKFSPLYNASNLQMGHSVQMCNQMNAGNTDYYGTTAQIQNGLTPYDYKYADNSVLSTATWGTTNTYYHKVACTKQLLSPANTNYTAHDMLFGYNTFVDPESDIRYWITAGTDDSPTLQNSKDKEDWAMITVQGLTGTNNTIMTMMIGICKSNQVWHNNWGVARATINCLNNPIQYFTNHSYGSITTLGYLAQMPNNSYFQDPALLLNGYNYRQGDVSLLGLMTVYGSAEVERLLTKSKYSSFFGSDSSTYDGLALCLLGQGNSNGFTGFYATSSAYNCMFDSDEPYKTGKMFLDIFKDLFISPCPGAGNRYQIGAASNSASLSSSSYPFLSDKSWFQFPEGLLYCGNNIAGNIVPNSVNAGDYVSYNGRKYLFVKYAGATTYAYTMAYNNCWYIDSGAAS